MDDQVPKQVVQERFDRLLDAQTQISRERNEEMIGDTVELTIERATSKNDASRATGRTRTNKLVHVPSEGWGPGDTAMARITDASAHYLSGQPT
jgi:tRNA-2-methylthio-N6-dimethylallyladenosine synthase